MEATNENYLIDSVDTTSSGVSWAAIFAGATTAASLSLILLVLGVGLGFSTISPWPNTGISATTLGVSTIVWLVLTQIAASGMGGYLAGRLRIKWATVHTDEVYFRDTAHGFLAWAVASLVVMVLVGTVMGKAISGVGSTATSLATTALAKAGEPGIGASGSGSLISSDEGANKDAANSSVDGMSNLQTTIVAQEQNAKIAADKARKATAYSALWMFVALLSGAFFASFSATLGGRQRDRVMHVNRVV